MTTEAVVILDRPESRAKARVWVAHAPAGTRVAFRRPRRSIPQNDRLHCLLTAIAGQVEWHGRKLDIEAWKDVFTAALRTEKHQLETVPGINGGFVMLGMHTSSMSKEELGELMELVTAFGAERGVTFSDTKGGPDDLPTPR